jgi:hypothetical protein
MVYLIIILLLFITHRPDPVPVLTKERLNFFPLHAFYEWVSLSSLFSFLFLLNKINIQEKKMWKVNLNMCWRWILIRQVGLLNLPSTFLSLSHWLIFFFFRCEPSYCTLDCSCKVIKGNYTLTPSSLHYPARICYILKWTKRNYSVITFFSPLCIKLLTFIPD